MPDERTPSVVAGGAADDRPTTRDPVRACFIRLRLGQAQAAELHERLERQGARAFRDKGVVDVLWPESDDGIVAWFEAWLEESPRGTVSILDERTLEVGEELFHAASPDPQAPPKLTS
jgi:hypothetical protein